MARWQLVAMTMLAGLASGTLGAIVYGRFTKPPAPPAAPAAAEPRPSPPVIPPGWNVALVSRLANVEQKVDELKASATLPSKSTAPAEAQVPSEGDEAAREQERTDAYRTELEFLKKTLDEHENEPLDGSWATPQAASMEQALATALKGRVQAKRVDCRSKTCTATLSFPTAGDALVSVQQQYAKLTVPGCKGMIAIPAPPVQAGTYDLTLIYNNCR